MKKILPLVLFGLFCYHAGYEGGKAKTLGAVERRLQKRDEKTMKKILHQELLAHVNTDLEISKKKRDILSKTLDKKEVANPLEEVIQRSGSIVYKKDRYSSSRCNFSIVTPNIIATASHCIPLMKGDEIYFNKKITLTSAYGKEKREVKPTDLLFYSPRNDLAFLYVKKAFTLPKEPGCVATPLNEDGVPQKQLNNLLYKSVRHKNVQKIQHASLRKGKVLVSFFNGRFAFQENAYEVNNQGEKIVPGDSGTGIYNNKGCLMGVAVTGDKKSAMFTHYLESHIARYVAAKEYK